jgi:hypothetical protein
MMLIEKKELRNINVNLSVNGQGEQHLKVDGNEKRGGSGRRQ